MSRPEGAKSDTNVKTAQMVDLISEIGPDVPEISRRLGQFKESVRYRYKEKILKPGMVVQAIVDFRRLGLNHVELIVDFGDEFRGFAQTILTAMNELCYVTSFEKLLPKGEYLVSAEVPEEHADAFLDFVGGLVSKGLFASAEVHTFRWFRRIPMRADFYDFNTGRWDFDWSARRARGLESAGYVEERKVRFDFTDLLILKELHVDASRSWVEVARKLGVPYKTLVWHYSTHVLRSRMIDGYTLRWPGTRYDTRSDRAMQRRHRYFWVDVIASDLSKTEALELVKKFSGVPFLWGIAGGRDISAEMAFPVDSYNEAMLFLEKTLQRVRDRARLHLIDQTNALAFTMSYKLYDQQSKRWAFNRSELMPKFENLLLKISEKGD